MGSDVEVVGCRRGHEQKDTFTNGEKKIIPVPRAVTVDDRCKSFKVTYSSCKDCPHAKLSEVDSYE